MRISSILWVVLAFGLSSYWFGYSPDPNVLYVVGSISFVLFICMAIERATDQICKCIKESKS